MILDAMATDGCVDMVYPVNMLHPQNTGKVFWGLCLPGIMGGSRLVNLMRPGDRDGNHGMLIPSGFGSGPRWGGPLGRPGGHGSLYFDNVAPPYVQVANHPTIAISTPLTMLAWVKRDATAENDYAMWIRGGGGGYAMFISSDNAIHCWSFGAADERASSGTITDTNWHHIGCVMATGGAGAFYIDGQPAGTFTGLATPDVSTGNLLFGARSDSSGVPDGASDHWQDDTLLYNRALADAEVLAIYNESRQFYPMMLNRIRRTSVVQVAAAAGFRSRIAGGLVVAG